MQIPNSNSPFGSPPLPSLGESLFQQNKLTIDLPSATPQLKGLMGLGSLGSGMFHCFVVFMRVLDVITNIFGHIGFFFFFFFL